MKIGENMLNIKIQKMLLGKLILKEPDSTILEKYNKDMEELNTKYDKLLREYNQTKRNGKERGKW